MVYSIQQVRAILGYVSEDYTAKVIEECLAIDDDYVQTSGGILVTEAALQELAIVARSQRGCKANYLPELLIVERSRLFRKGVGRANTRYGQAI